MRHPFDLDNFESFLSEQADQHRMFASDRVWRNIQENLHGLDRWPALSFASILTVSVIAIVLTITYPNRQLFNKPADFSSFNTENVENASVSHHETALNKHLTNSFGVHVNSRSHSTSSHDASNQPEKTHSIGATSLSGSYANLSESGITEQGEKSSLIASEDPENVVPALEDELSSNGVLQETATPLPAISITMVNPENSLRELGSPAVASKAKALGETQETIAREAFLNTSLSYGPQSPNGIISKQSRWSLQLYATPSISYRYWLQDKQFEHDPNQSQGPLAPYLTNTANDFVIHKPKMGLEAGGAALYQVAENLRLKTGLQINYRQYGILAFQTATTQPAMLTLNRGNVVDSIVRYTSLSTQAGFRELDLTSSFVQLAIPIGFDLKLASLKNVDFYASASGQLTYQLANNSYLISSDYKNYIKQTGLDRKFNINTAIEAFASFEAGGVTWQAGPQIRYQILSGTKSVYPIREHLIDYGFKIGVVKTLK